MLRRIFGSRQWLAVAIMPRTICYLQLKQTFRGLHIATMALEPFTQSVHSGAKITNFSRLAECLQIGAAARHSRQPMATCVSATEVQIKTLLVPAVFSAEEVEMEVKAQLQRAMAGRKAEIKIDYAQYDVGGVDEIKTDIVAAKADYIVSLQSCFEQQNMNLQIIDIDLFALIRAAKFITADSVNPSAMIYVDERYAICAGWERRKLIFHQAYDADAGDLNVWLQQLGQTYQGAKLKHVLLFVQKNKLTAVKAAIEMSWSCAAVEPDIQALVNDFADLFKDNPEGYVALGLALRGISNGF